jgi:hypothetical protein
MEMSGIHRILLLWICWVKRRCLIGRFMAAISKAPRHFLMKVEGMPSMRKANAVTCLLGSANLIIMTIVLVRWCHRAAASSCGEAAVVQSSDKLSHVKPEEDKVTGLRPPGSPFHKELGESTEEKPDHGEPDRGAHAFTTIVRMERRSPFGVKIGGLYQSNEHSWGTNAGLRYLESLGSPSATKLLECLRDLRETFYSMLRPGIFGRNVEDVNEKEKASLFLMELGQVASLYKCCYLVVFTKYYDERFSRDRDALKEILAIVPDHEKVKLMMLAYGHGKYYGLLSDIDTRSAEKMVETISHRLGKCYEERMKKDWSNLERVVDEISTGLCKAVDVLGGCSFEGRRKGLEKLMRMFETHVARYRELCIERLAVIEFIERIIGQIHMEHLQDEKLAEACRESRKEIRPFDECFAKEHLEIIGERQEELWRYFRV